MSQGTGSLKGQRIASLTLWCRGRTGRRAVALVEAGDMQKKTIGLRDQNQPFLMILIVKERNKNMVSCRVSLELTQWPPNKKRISRILNSHEKKHGSVLDLLI